MKNFTINITIFQSVDVKFSKSENVKDGCINASEFFVEWQACVGHLDFVIDILFVSYFQTDE